MQNSSPKPLQVAKEAVDFTYSWGPGIEVLQDVHHQQSTSFSAHNVQTETSNKFPTAPAASPPKMAALQGSNSEHNVVERGPKGNTEA